MLSVTDQLKEWQQSRSKIRALFTGKGLQICFPGFVRLLPSNGTLCLVDEQDSLLLSLDVENLPSKRLEPLLDLPEDVRWKIDFIVAVEFETLCGSLGLYETAD